MARGAAPLSLKARALQLLAQRDQSRLELRRKLLAHRRKHAAANALSRAAEEGCGEEEQEAEEKAEAEVDALLDWLEAHRYLSAERFVESRVHARESRFGNQRIRAELALHGAELTPEQDERLRASEFERAAAVHGRRFDHLPQNAAERAAQQRFLASRGFGSEVIQQVLRGKGADG